MSNGKKSSMLKKITHSKSIHESEVLFYSFGFLLLASLFLGIALEKYFLFVIPAIVLFTFQIIVDFRKVFYLLFALIPLSTELSLPGGFSTDFPVEPLTVVLMGVFFLFLIKNGKDISGKFYLHPISLLLLLHFAWIFTTTIFSTHFFISFKYLLAKTWYIVVFYLMAGQILKKNVDIKKLFWWIFIPLLLTILVIMARHSGYGFTFKSVNKILHPFYRNHVDYACAISVFMPLLWMAWVKAKKGSGIKYLLFVSLLFFLVAIQLTYTRTAYISMFLVVGYYYIVQFRLTKFVVGISIIGIFILTAYLGYNNKYLDLAPDYQTTTVHREFDDLVSATYKGKDVSTMERVYRWVAAGNMIKEKPVIGFGPGTFIFAYRPYTLHGFETYVSDNPEMSGTHNYFFMVASEQGIPGLIIFLVILFYFLIKGENIYFESKDKKDRQIVMMSILTMLIVITILLMNDMIETDKVGPYFFLSLAILVNMDLKNKRLEQAN